ncbi:hypothetical protein [Ferrimicrobium sp.]|uniref:hypothetical protein n=1 Tax=Ferrimicrobium sp. TaxID=2926050 RepID=UPI0026244F4D|nr:hypothetical protein [Ferrimicrobium sp.]
MGSTLCDSCLASTPNQDSSQVATESRPNSLAYQLSRFAPSVRYSIRDGAMMVLGLYVFLVVVSVAVVGVIHGSGLGNAGVLRIAGWLTGLTFRGHLIAAAGSGSEFNASLSAYIQLGLPFVLAMSAIAVLARRTERLHPSKDWHQMLLYATATGLGAGVVTIVISLITSAYADFVVGGLNINADVHMNIVSAFLGVFFFTGIVAAVTKIVTAWKTEVIPERLRHHVALWTPGAIGFAWFATVGVVLSALTLIITLLVLPSSAQVWLTTLTELPFILLWVFMVSFGIPVSVSGSLGLLGSVGGATSQSVGLTYGSWPVAAWLIVLIPLTALIVGGIKITTRYPAQPKPAWAHCWRTALLGAVGGWLTSFLTLILIGGSGNVSMFSGQIYGSIGVNWAVAIIGGATIGALIPLVGFYLTRLLGARLPKPIAFVVLFHKGTIDPSWEQILGSTNSLNTGVSFGAPGTDERHSSVLSDRINASGLMSLHPKQLAKTFRMTKRWWIGVVATVSLAVMAVAAVIVINVMGSAFTPSSVAKSYLSDIATGNASGALSRGGGHWAGPWLTSTVLRRQDAASPISHIVVGTASIQGSTATVPVSYWVGTTPVLHDDLTLYRSGSQDLFFSHWIVATPVVRLGTPSGGVFVDGIKTPSKGGTILVFPGSPIKTTPPDSDPYVSTQLTHSGSSVLTPGASTLLGVRQQLTPVGRHTVISSIDNALKRCLSSTSVTPPGCPFNDPYASFYQPISHIRWTVSAMPSLRNVALSLHGKSLVNVDAQYDVIEVNCSYDYSSFFGTQSNQDTDISAMTTASVTLTPHETPKVTFQSFQ